MSARPPGTAPRLRASRTGRLPGGRAGGWPLARAAGLALGPVVALGLGRFAYSLLLPAMRADLHWSFAEAGAMNAANAIGYLAGAVATGPLVARVGSRRPYLAGLAVVVVALLASAGTGNFGALLALRLVTGAAGALVFIAGAGLAAHLAAGAAPKHSASLLGVYFAGGGLGIIISAVAVPPVVSGGSWRWGWVVLGLVSLAAVAAAAPVAARADEPATEPGAGVLSWPVRSLAATMAAYGLFGAGYIAYITFIVAFVTSQGLGTGTVSAFWAVLGAAAIAATFAWGPALHRLHGGRGPAVVLAVVSTGALLAVVIPGAAGAFASAVFFGGGFLAVVTAVVNLARRSLRPAQVTPAIAVLTVAFGIGQSLGPVLAGVLSDGTGGVRAGLDLAVALLAAAALAALAQRAPAAAGGPA